MILNELFNSAARFQLTADGTGYFNIKDKAYVVDFSQYEDKDTIEISFSQRQGEDLQGSPKYTYGVSGGGDELLVFGTVIAITHAYLKKHPVRHIVFSSKTDETSRIKLYDRMVQRLAPGWELDMEESGSEKIYKLTDPKYGQAARAQPAPQSMPDVPF